MKLPENRYPEIDLVKTLAIFSVVMIHVFSMGTAPLPHTFPWYASVFWRCVASAAVPLFFMSNGALLLNPKKELTMKKLFTSRLPKLLIPLFFWAIAYKLFELFRTGNLNFPALINEMKEVLLFDHMYHLYFLHIMLLVYVFLPLTRRLLKNAEKKEIRYILALWFVLGILYPTFSGFRPLNFISGIPDQWALNLTYCAIGYTILGYCFHKEPPSLLLSLLLLVSGFAFTFIGTVTGDSQTGSLYTVFLNGNSLGIALYAAGIYGLCCGRKGKMAPRCQTFAYLGSKISFSVYLVHVFVITVFLHWRITPDILPRIISMPLVTLLIIAASSLAYIILSFIPITKKWLI